MLVEHPDSKAPRGLRHADLNASDWSGKALKKSGLDKLAKWLHTTICVKLAQATPGVEWQRMEPFIHQPALSQKNTLTNMITSWLTDPYSKYVKFKSKFTSGCKFNESETFKQNAERLLDRAVNTENHVYQPVPDEEAFRKLAEELDNVDKDLLRKMETLYANKLFTAAHMSTVETVVTAERASAPPSSSSVRSNSSSSEQVEEIVVASGRPTPSPAQIATITENITSAKRPKPKGKTLSAQDSADMEDRRKKMKLEIARLEDEKEMRVQEKELRKIHEEKLRFELQLTKAKAEMQQKMNERAEKEAKLLHEINMLKLRRKLQKLQEGGDAGAEDEQVVVLEEPTTETNPATEQD